MQLPYLKYKEYSNGNYLCRYVVADNSPTNVSQGDKHSLILDDS